MDLMSDDHPKKDLTLLTDLPLEQAPTDFPTTQTPATPETPFGLDFQEQVPTFEDTQAPEQEPVAITPPEPTPDAVPVNAPVPTTPTEISSQEAWNLSLIGVLRPEHRARLIDIVTREPIGIREVDLEPQFEAGRVLIPRISEYLGVLLIQALRDAAIEIHFEPAMEAFEEQSNRQISHAQVVHSSQDERAFAFDQVLLTADSTLPGVSQHLLSPIDVLVVSATLTHAEVESRHDALNAHVFDDRLESLKRELKARAYYRGAHAILDFSLELQPLKDPALYKLMLTGTAVHINGADGAVSRANPPEQIP